MDGLFFVFSCIFFSILLLYALGRLFYLLQQKHCLKLVKNIKIQFSTSNRHDGTSARRHVSIGKSSIFFVTGAVFISEKAIEHRLALLEFADKFSSKLNVFSYMILQC